MHQNGPLSGLRVVDLTVAVAGPWVGTLLAELGADVLKIEQPAGDGQRTQPPLQRGLSTSFICVNLNKRTVALNLKDPATRDTVLRLIDHADVMVHNFRGGAMDRLGLGYRAVSERNPRLVYCAVSGFGDVGPLAGAGSADYLIQAFTGFARLNGAPGDQLEQFRFTGLLDLATASVAVESILAALIGREISGRGQHIEVSMVEAALEAQITRVAEYFANGVPPVPLGDRSASLVPDRCFETPTGPFFVTVHDQVEWAAFCAAVERPELADAPEFRSNGDRVAHRGALDAILEPLFGSRPAVWWLRVFERHGVPCGLAQHFEITRHHAQMLENDMLGRLSSPERGTLVTGGLPWHFSATPGVIVSEPVPSEPLPVVVERWKKGIVDAAAD